MSKFCFERSADSTYAMVYNQLSKEYEVWCEDDMDGEDEKPLYTCASKKNARKAMIGMVKTDAADSLRRSTEFINAVRLVGECDIHDIMNKPSQNFVAAAIRNLSYLI